MIFRTGEKKMLVVGLTGGIASGKSTVSRRLSEKHKIPIVDADRIARQVVEPGTKGFNQIVEYFGDKIPDIITEDGTLNRPALGNWVFSHPADLKVLNGITHPAVRLAMLEEVMKYYVKGYRMCILDVPLLFEARLDTFCGVTISVVCDEDTQLERLQIRNPNISKEEARNRIRSQMSTRERIGRSDYVIRNDSTLTDLYEKVDSIVREITPTSVRMLLEYFPPFGFISAMAIVLSRLFVSKIRGRRDVPEVQIE